MPRIPTRNGMKKISYDLAGGNLKPAPGYDPGAEGFGNGMQSIPYFLSGDFFCVASFVGLASEVVSVFASFLSLASVAGFSSFFFASL